MSSTYVNKSRFKNEIDLVDKILTIYSVAKFSEENKLRTFEKDILIYYVRKGITEDTINMVCEDLNKKKNYLHGINKHLKDKGYLISSKTNYRKFDLNDDLKQIRKAFLKDGLRMYTIVFLNG